MAEEKYETPHERTQRRWDEEKKQWLSKYGYLRDMLSSPVGMQFMGDLKSDSLNTDMYVPDSFDRTAFNLGKLHVYLMLERIQKGDF